MSCSSPIDGSAVPSRLARVADRLGSPRFWGRLGARVLGFAIVIGGAGLLLAASVAPTFAVALTAVSTVDEQMFDFPPMPRTLGEPVERSVVLDRNGGVLAVLHDVENRKLVELVEIPQHVRDAVIATEDAAFFEHEGVDWRAVARAAAGNYRAGEIRSGASTITQQLVKLAVTKDTSETLERKLREAVYATALERELSKDQILGEYLNLAYFGNGVYGVATAAEYYFDRPVGQLTVEQGAMLAGLIRAPQLNDPIDHPDAALGRRNIVLGQMADHGFISRGQARRLSTTALGIQRPERQPTGDSFFVTYVTQLLKDEPALGPDRASRAAALLRGGLTIRTTLDPRADRAANRAIRKVLRDTEGPQAALTAVDPRTGEILAMGVGPKQFGKGRGRTQVTPAAPHLGSPAGRQPGSAFKGFQVVAALEEGISPHYRFQAGASYTTSNPACVDDGEDYEVGNYADASQGLLDMVSATAKSSNTYFTHLVDLTGPDKLVEVAQRMGIRSRFGTPFCSYVLGTKDVYGIDLAAGYGTLANNGVHCPPYAISEVIDRRGRRLLGNDGSACTPAVEPDVAAWATELLRGPIEFGTATSNGPIGRPAAGKTGTTNAYRDAWFVGYVPQLSASTWVGYPNRTKPMYDPRCSSGRVTGGCLPTMIWSRFMRTAVVALDLEPRDFPPPPPLPTGTVPHVVGQPRPAAVRLLREAQLIVDVERVSHHAPAGTTVFQSPVGGRTVELGTGVEILVSDGRGSAPTMPDLIGLTRSEADAELRRRRLLATAVTVPVTDDDDYGRVVGQTPAAGSSLDEGSELVVEIGRAPTADEQPGDQSGGGSPAQPPDDESAEEPGDKTRGKGKGRGR